MAHLTDTAEIEASRTRWKRRAKLFQRAYRDADFEVLALELQKWALEAEGADKMTRFWLASARVRAEKAVREASQLRSLLRQAQEQVCSMLCPSIWKTGERPSHSALCQQITAALGDKEQQ